MRSLTKRLSLAAAAVAILALVALFLRPPAVPVELGRVTRGPLVVTLEEDGETRIHPRHLVAAPIAGRLAASELHPGDPVRLGEAVAWIAPAPLDPRGREQAEAALRAARASGAEARARVAEARTARESSRSTLARVERLASTGQVSEEDLELGRSEERRLSEALAAAEARARAAAFAVEAAQAALLGSTAQAALPAPATEGGGAAVAVRSPVDGVVLRLLEESERVVAAGTSLLEVGDPTALEVVVDVLTGDALAVRPGAEMLLDAGSSTAPALRARVRRVEPAAFTKVSPLGVEEQRVNVVGDLLDPAPRLGDRFRVEAQIVLWRGEAVLQAPAAALFRRGEEWAAFVVSGGRARERAVSLGRRGASEVEVLAGLAEGDTVVLYPSDRVAEGARLALP